MAEDASYLDGELLESAYVELNSNLPTYEESSIYSDIYGFLKPESDKHDSFLQQYFSSIDDSSGSISATHKDITDRYRSLVSSLYKSYNATLNANSDGAVDTSGVSGGGGTSGGSSVVPGDYSGGSLVANPNTPTVNPELTESLGKSPSLQSSKSSTTPTSTTTTSPSYRDTSVRSVNPGTSGGSLHTGASIGAGAGALGSAIGSIATDLNGGDSIPVIEYPLGNYSVDASFINGLSKEELTQKLKDIGFTDNEINAIMNGDYDVSKVLVDAVSEKLAEAYKAESGIRDYLRDQYGFDIFNDDGSVNNDRLSLALYMDDKSGFDNYSIINTLSSKYGIDIVDTVAMKSYIGQFESMFMKDSKIRDRFKEQYGFDIFNSDGTINKDRLVLAMLIDDKSDGKYSIIRFLKEEESSALVNTLGNNMTKLGNNKSHDSSKIPYIAGAAAVGAAAVGTGIAINKKKEQEEEEQDGENRFITEFDYDEEDSDDWVHNIIDSEIDNE